jgi:hypothetical protein
MQDYLLFFLSLVMIFLFLFLGLNKLYKAIFWIAIWFVLFSLFNMTYSSLNNSDIWFLAWIKDFLVNNKILILNFSFYSVIFFSLLTAFNNRFNFTNETSSRLFQILRVVIFAPFLLFFYISIITCSLQNNFIFSIDSEFVTSLETSIFWLFFNYFSGNSIIFDFIVKNNYLISLIWFIFVLYILTIWGLVRRIMLFLKEKFTPVWRAPKQAEIDKLLADATNNLVNK